MAALVQSFPQQSSTVTMLQARPASASGILQGTSQNQTTQYGQRTGHLHRNSYHGMGNGAGLNTYRGQSSIGPIAPYAFTSTPALTGYRQQQTPYVRQDQRTTSAPAVPNMHGSQQQSGNRLSRYPASASVSTTTSSSSSEISAPTTRDDASENAVVWEATRVRPKSTIITSSPVLSASGPSTPTKTAPDRYRRPANRRVDTAPVLASTQVTGTPSVFGSNANSIYQPLQVDQNVGFQFGNRYQAPPALVQNFNSGNTLLNGSRGAVDDMYLQKHATKDDRRRRSIHTIDATYGESDQFSNVGQQGYHLIGPNQHPLRSSPVIRPTSSPENREKYESLANRHNQPRPSSAPKRVSGVIAAGINPAPGSVAAVGSVKQDQPQLVNIPARGSSSDATKRIASPSPLSKPMTMSPEPAVTKDTFASTVTAALQTPVKADGARPQSPAAQKLAALNDKGGKKPSRLRRAFSFGSAAELRKASIENNANNSGAAADRARTRKEQFQNEQEAEQARIAQKQEEGGIGSGIYSGQGNFFSGSTDNLSISSTASSASIMIRKMGKGMKKSTRSLVGLFRPKSVIGVPAADSAVPEASVGEVSMVNVEADRQRVNVNNVSKEDNSNGTGFQRLELTSFDATNAASGGASGTTDNVSVGLDSAQRKSILGGDKERAEVLAAVKKGILKRSGTDSGSSSPVVQPADSKALNLNFGLPQIPHVDDSPQSSAPSTPNDDAQGHRRTGSVTLSGEDYFMSALNFTSNAKSATAAPTAKRNISWKNTTNYHDTWASSEYDRRGEIATCNRLTPMLAQQIKEELNTFKMEMEVHENSKIYTHFF